MKLSPITVYILGLAVAVIALSYGLFYQFIPNSKEASNYAERREELEQEASKLTSAKNRVKAATELVKAKASQWQAVVATRTPPKTLSEGGISLAVNPYQLAVDTRIYRNNLQKAINQQVTAGGVKVLSGPAVPGPGADEPVTTLLANFYNYPAVGYPVVVRDLGTVTVEGTIEQIYANIRAWRRMPHYLAVADGLRLTGTAPKLTGTYTLSIVGYIRAKDNEIYPSLEASSGTTAGGAAAPGAAGPGAFGPGAGAGASAPAGKAAGAGPKGAEGGD
jgi:hypothetical protein